MPHSSVFETQHARKNCGDCTTPDARLADQVGRPSWSQQISASDVALLRRSLQHRDSHSCHLCYTAARSSSASAGRQQPSRLRGKSSQVMAIEIKRFPAISITPPDKWRCAMRSIFLTLDEVE